MAKEYEYSLMWLDDTGNMPKIIESVTVDAKTLDEAKAKARRIFMERRNIKNPRDLNNKIFLSYKGEIPQYPLGTDIRE